MVQNGHETKSVPFKTKLYVCCMLTEEGLKVGVQVQLHRAPAPPACPPGLPHPPVMLRWALAVTWEELIPQHALLLVKAPPPASACCHNDYSAWT